MSWQGNLREVYDKDLIPSETKEALDRYVFNHVPPGGFLEAVLTNDLRGAFVNADKQNLNALPAIVAYVYNQTPVVCRGTPERYERWLTHRG